MRDILILMSTYNGGKYLREQLDSILNQEDVTPHLIVRDDGSKDNSIEIVKEYLPRFGEKSSLIEGENIGWKKSYFELMKLAAEDFPEFQYYAFADQDDIWMPEKLITAIRMLDDSGDGIRLYCSNLTYYKDGESYGVIKKNINPTYKNCLVRNYATGCTIVFNNKFLKAISPYSPDVEFAHDYWVYIFAVLCGKVVVDPHSHILYRQHANNALGSEKSLFHRWKRRFKYMKETWQLPSKADTAKNIIDLFGDMIHPEAYSFVDTVARYRLSLRNRIRLLKDPEVSFGNKENDFWLKIKIISGVF